MIAQSAVMRRVGVNGLGLYAAKPMPKDTVIGRYEGTVVAHYDTRDEALHSQEAAYLVQRGVDKIVTFRSRDGPGWDVIDGTAYAHRPPCIPLVNDPRNTRLRANCVLSEHGYLQATRNIPAFKLSASVSENVDCELRIEYGSQFWELVESVGTSAAPIVCE